MHANCAALRAAILVGLACGGESGDSEQGQPSLLDACGAYCENLESCFPGEQPGCIDECTADAGAPESCESALAAWYDCLGQAACTDLMSACSTEEEQASQECA